MSALLMGAVWYIELSPPEQTIMLVLADHAKDDGTDIYPSVKMMAWKAGKKERQVQNILRRLEQKRLIIPVAYTKGGRGHATRYEMHIENGVRKPAFKSDEDVKGAIDGQDAEERVQSSVKTLNGAVDGHERVQSVVIKGAIAIAPEPSDNHQREDIQTTAAALPSHVHARTHAREAAAAEWDETVLSQTAERIRQHLRMNRDKLDGLKIILRQFNPAPAYFEREAVTCFETLRVRPISLKHFANWLDTSELRRLAQQEAIQHDSTGQAGSSAPQQATPAGRGVASTAQSDEEYRAGMAAVIEQALADALRGGAGEVQPVPGDDE